jgi:hypothetical protein
MTTWSSRGPQMNRDSPLLSYIDDGDKYALVGLSVKLEGNIPQGPVASHLSVLADTRLEIPAHWREWLGTIRTEELEACNLFLLSTLRSTSPGVLDEENKTLQQRVWRFYVGLLLTSTFATAHKPVTLSGARRGGELGLRAQQDLDFVVPCIFRAFPPVVGSEIEVAAHLTLQIEALGNAKLTGGHWRLFRTLHIYYEARSRRDIIDRLHQYCRCIDGLILPKAGETKRQFKSRTELFIGPRHHDVMGEIYDVRSAVEHLHENRYLEGFDRAIRLDLVQKEAIVEHIARTSLARVIGCPELWPHFANTSALAAFWSLPALDRRRIWGDPLVAVKDFDPQYIHDGELGAA